MRQLTDVEYDILNVLYFVEPFEKILEEVNNIPENIVRDGLRFLIAHRMVAPMKWDAKKKDYTRSNIYDGDDMRAYRYLITREGLVAHNGR